MVANQAVFSFPIFRTKVEGVRNSFTLSDPIDRARYFEAKAGVDIEKLRDYLRDNTFVAYLIGKKNSGKGTYTKLFAEAVAPDRVAHISVGDIVRAAQKALLDRRQEGELRGYLARTYRGFVDLNSALNAVLNWDVRTPLATELILALVRREIDGLERKAIFVDGFPRDLDQVSYSLYFRDLIGYRDDPDFFVFIDVPRAVVDERMKTRVICPRCLTPRSLKLARTKEIGYNAATKAFYLLCDNDGAPMVAKKGDELGIEAIRARIEADEAVARTLAGLQGVPKVYLRNAIPVAVAREYVDDYEITPVYRYEWDEPGQKVRVIEEPWVVNDDEGTPSYSLLPAPVALALIKQTTQVLGL